MPGTNLPKTGNRFIDADHARLATLIREAADAARDEAEEPVFLSIVAEFRRLLGHHFEIEEVIVGGAGYSSATQHEERHAEILTDIDAMIADLSGAKTAAVRFAAVDRMEKILFDHEIVEDSLYWEILADNDKGKFAQEALKWHAEYELGIDWIDEQHRGLLELLVKLMDSAGSKDRQDESGPLLDAFQTLARCHFSEEEHYLLSLGKPMTEHRRAHQGLLEGLNEMAARCKAKPETLATDYLTFWVLDHIRGIDRVDFAPA